MKSSVYDAMLRDGVSKRAESVDSLPTCPEVWGLLRGLYGKNLLGATLVAIIDHGGDVTVQTVVLPKDATK